MASEDGHSDLASDHYSFTDETDDDVPFAEGKLEFCTKAPAMLRDVSITFLECKSSDP